MTRVVLGSASPARRKVLRQAGIDPLVVVSGVDEDAIMAALGVGASPADVTSALAGAKARQVAGNLDAVLAADCVVIGCDSMLYVDGELRGKPESPVAALQQWLSMAGRAGELHTGHCVIALRGNSVAYHGVETAVTTVRFGVPDEDDLRAYIESGEPLTVAGAFTIDGLGGWFIDGVDGDPSSVIGISLPLIRRLLAAAGLPMRQLWADNRRN
ncbi:MAG: septum formation inhibitor Maf [Mycobacteriaceae bacterium]|nr:septum formation inhibitor Maf [Mycobacteriaceae bacterium]MBV9641829.1 septum formation inhibitor Maf [Mycobacteriaceae bacterium]